MGFDRHKTTKRPLVAFVIAALVVLGGCSSPSTADGSDPGAQAPETPSRARSKAQGDATTAAPGEDDVAGSSAAPGEPDSALGAIAPTPGEAAPDASGEDLPGPPPANFPYKTPVPARAVLTPTCVAPGGRIELEVDTASEAAVAYHAIYADGYGGSGAPYGRGYGGNDKGFATKGGSYTSTWIVAPNTPAGPARVDVVIGHKGKWGYDDPHFAVADSDGDCPQRWIEGSGRRRK